MTKQDQLELEAALREWGIWKAYADRLGVKGFALPQYEPRKSGVAPVFYLPRTELVAVSYAVAKLRETNAQAAKAISNKFLERMVDPANGKNLGMKRHALSKLLRYAYGYIHALRPIYASAAMDMTERELEEVLGGV